VGDDPSNRAIGRLWVDDFFETGACHDISEARQVKLGVGKTDYLRH
jgi:hypothetical protein